MSGCKKAKVIWCPAVSRSGLIWMRIWKFYSSKDNLLLLSELFWSVWILILTLSASFKIHNKFIGRYTIKDIIHIISNSRDDSLTAHFTLFKGSCVSFLVSPCIPPTCVYHLHQPPPTWTIGLNTCRATQPSR